MDGLDFDVLYPGRFIKAGLLAGKDVILTITGVRLEKLAGDDGKKRSVIVSFKERDKELVLCKTNGVLIREMFGRNTADWIDKRITLFPATKADKGLNMRADLALRIRGSPDITKVVQVNERVGLEYVTIALRPTKVGKPANGKHAAPPNPEPLPAPEPDEWINPETGEVETSPTDPGAAG